MHLTPTQDPIDRAPKWISRFFARVPDTAKISRATHYAYDLPPEFWSPILGVGMNYHMGHFQGQSVTCAAAMDRATESLLELSKVDLTGKRILDVGCGWGGPLRTILKSPISAVTAITNSFRQMWYIQKEMRSYPVRVLLADLESPDIFAGVSKYDVILIIESLEHVCAKDALLERLHSNATSRATLAIAITCRGARSPVRLHNELLGIQPLLTLPEIDDLLRSSGWQLQVSRDVSHLTQQTWTHYLRSASMVAADTTQAHSEYAKQLIGEYRIARFLAAQGWITSHQLVARRS